MSLDHIIVEITKKLHDICNNTENFNAFDYKKYTRDGFMTWSKTDKGLILKYSYGSINSLISPYGELRLIGDNSSKYNALEVLHNKIINSFDLELYNDIIETEMGCFGPWYRIKSYNGIRLDKPQLIEDNIDLDYDDCKKKYKELFGGY